MKPLDLIGARFGKLVVVSRADNNARGRTMWNCACDCGGSSVVNGSELRTGGTVSCGCHRLSVLRTNQLQHGMANTPEHRTWAAIRRRCENPSDKRYSYYGGRGIQVCQRWRDSFENFFADMGPRPDGYSIERKDVNGNYEPSNCLWIPMLDQADNKRTTKVHRADRQALVEFHEKHGTKATAERFGVHSSRVRRIVASARSARHG